MSQSQETPADSRRGGFGTVLWVAGLVLIVYVLSVGPVAKLIEHDVISEDLAAPVYAPLQWLADNCEPVDDFFGWYVDEVWRHER